MDRREFAKGFAAAASALALRPGFSGDKTQTGDPGLDARQNEIDAIEPGLFEAYWKPGLEMPACRLASLVKRYPALGRLEDAFAKVFREARETLVTDINRPAVWYVYNMGLVVKTPKSMFSIDLHHRRAEEFAPLLDFALITHNHDNHYTERFKVALDGVQRKPVVNNFFDNYGVPDRRLGGYTRARTKTFRYGDVEIITGLCDHNSYLVDYTTPFEVHVGDYTIFHSGDCSGHEKLHVTRQPDIWVLHPRCIMDAVKGCAEAVRHRLAVVAHLQEMGHARDRYRWTYRDGLDEKARIEAAGFKAAMPLWG